MFEKLYLGDSLKIMSEFEDNSIDLIITDPPYLISEFGLKRIDNRQSSGLLGDKKLEFQDFPDISNYINILYKILKNDSHAYIMCNHKQLPIFFNAIENSDFNFCQLLTWEKTNNQILTNFYLLKNEFIFLLSKGYKEINNKKFPTVIRAEIKYFNRGYEKKHHITEKPIRLMEIFIEASSKENDVVLDWFMGSGTTGIAAKRNNRKFIGIEIDKKYFDIAEKRINEYQGILI